MSDENTFNDAEDQEMNGDIHAATMVSGMYESWFLDYASYVILERAVPAIQDGLKPVQRRILHSMKELDDGRFNKVANIIGATMQYHPHGDASIGDAIVTIGQKDLLIETQGNWGDIRTGDRSAAPRYIEARLSKFALDVVYNPQTTDWQLSYDGRKKEPITLPVKFPLLLAQGVEGIAVGLSTKMMPHNFVELIKASIDILKGKRANILPDFPTGGTADFTNYNEGKKGSKIRVRAKIEAADKKTLLIKDIPYSTTTSSVIDSILKANDKGKLKVKKVIDNTAKDVEIEIQLGPGQSPDVVIDALYAFTDCEVSISPNACVIIDEKPHFMSVNDILAYCTKQTVELLKQELEIRRGELMEKILFSSLEKIFIENRIYRDIEECETWEAVLQTIDQGLDPFKKDFYREITEEDLVRLTEIKIKRISKFDSFKADEAMKKLTDELAEVEHNLENLIDYAIAYFKDLLKKYGKGRERKTEIRNFEDINATVVAANNTKLYVNRTEGFIGTSLKKDEFVTDCSDIDDIIVFRRDGACIVTKISDKAFVGKDIIHVAVFKKNDDRMVYNVAYLDASKKRTFVKRFQVLAVTRDREYNITKGGPKSKILYFSANPNGEAEVVKVKLTPGCPARQKIFEYDFADLAIKGRDVVGNTLTAYPISKNGITKISDGVSTLGGIDVYYDDHVGRLNTEGRGKLLGNFLDQSILCILKDGSYELTNYELTNRYNVDEVVHIEQFDPEKPITAIYYDGNNKTHYVKRFMIETTTLDKRFKFITDARSSKMLAVTLDKLAQVEITYKRKVDGKTEGIFDLDVLAEVKGWRALGNKLSAYPVKSVKVIESKPAPVAAKSTQENVEVDEDDQEQLGLF
ncbi:MULTISPECIES: DNA gyrase/topoisomerase IV subunit A [Persicobacter]|uniref:DNA topoisomerase IV subunit A n=1 Tax=Persicobacter diffluens TaxID=981 RepID=A0AAN4VVH1_9BACT|nr:DNA gyrase/topoisomerase IV subunit A [Persicobacter sp. CCB-QB2]GJM60443.1 DNA topoisomerase IV subunit A [Persicobacter diffluens]